MNIKAKLVTREKEGQLRIKVSIHQENINIYTHKDIYT